MRVSAVRVTVVVEQEETDNVRSETQRTNNDDKAWVPDLCVGSQGRSFWYQTWKEDLLLRSQRVHSPVTLTKRSMASMKMEKHKASRKTPFTSAPRISALCQP